MNNKDDTSIITLNLPVTNTAGLSNSQTPPPLTTNDVILLESTRTHHAQ